MHTQTCASHCQSRITSPACPEPSAPGLDHCPEACFILRLRQEELGDQWQHQVPLLAEYCQPTYSLILDTRGAMTDSPSEPLLYFGPGFLSFPRREQSSVEVTPLWRLNVLSCFHPNPRSEHLK